MRVLIACPHLQREMDRFASQFADHGIEVEAPYVDQQLSEEWLIENIHRFDGVVAGDDPFTAAVIERAGRLRVLAKWGIGVDNIDLQAASRRGIPVLNTPGQLSAEVADVTLGYLIMLSRHLHTIDTAVRSGSWSQLRGVSLAEKRLGIIGLGGIGMAVAKRAIAHEMTVAGFDPYLKDPEPAKSLGIELLSLDTLLSTSDFVSLNCSLTPETHHLIGEKQFELMRTGSYLVNTSRGALVDEPYLVKALGSGKLAGAALDVFEVEPLVTDSPLRTFANCILGAHNSSNTQDAVDRINEMAVANLLGVLLKEKRWAA